MTTRKVILICCLILSAGCSVSRLKDFIREKPNSLGFKRFDRDEKKLDILNDFLKRYANGSYAKDVQTDLGNFFGVCLYVNDSTYPNLQRAFGLPPYSKDLMYNAGLLRSITGQISNWMFGEMCCDQRRGVGIMVVIGTAKDKTYYCDQFGYEEHNDFPGHAEPTIDLYPMQTSYHLGYELVKDCRYCF